jgi:cytochrome c oxidase subunit 2
MTALIILLSIILLVIVMLQVSKLSDLYSKIKGEEVIDERLNTNQGRAMLLFMIGLLVLCVVTAWAWKNHMMGYGPHKSASEHGGVLDSLFNVTLLFTGIVFVITHIALFYFAWRYKKVRGSKGTHWAHNNTLEVVWSAIPAVVMTYLVIKGLLAWNTVMADVQEGEEYLEIEATGYQFAWHLRYPGPDNHLGARDYKKITADNPLGQDWMDAKNHDDFHPDELWLPVNKKVRVRILARDVLHNFYLPHFRVKMDAVPGLPTYFVFTPTKTTEEYRDELRNYKEYNVPTDPDDPESLMRWETFNYELACAELCGRSHYSMRRIVRIVTEDEYNVWLGKQQSYYASSIRNKDIDPNKGKMLEFEVRKNRDDLNLAVETAINAATGVTAGTPPPAGSNVIQLNAIEFESGSTELTSSSTFQLNDLAEILSKYATMRIEVGGHTDNVGNPAANRALSQARANAVKEYLVGKGVTADRVTAVGYGDTKPLETNDTDEGRQKNRRTEFTITAQ